MHFRVFTIYHIRNTIYENGNERNWPSVFLDFSRSESMIESNLPKRESSIEADLEPSVNNEL